MSRKTKAQVAVIGGGPGGYAAAFRAADLGLDVVLIDANPNPGGVCLYEGCIPSKALLHVARLLFETRDSQDMGLRFSPPEIDLDRLRAWKEGVVSKLTKGLGQLSDRRRVERIRGVARFLDAHTLKIERRGGTSSNLIFDNAILATGSRPAEIPGQSLKSPRLLNSTSALELRKIPKTLLVVGGGYIGLELGTVYAALGTEVSLVEMTPGLLPGVDRDLVEILQQRMKNVFHSVRFNVRVVAMNEAADGINVKQETDGNRTEATFDNVLVAVGRKRNTNGIGLERTRVITDTHGAVRVDLHRRTTEPSVFAIGDVTEGPMLAHKATHEGIVAAEIIAGRAAAFEPRAIPAVVYTDPEIAWCGLTELEAEARGDTYKVGWFPWMASGRAVTLGRTDGATKLLIDAESDRVLGVGIVGVGAGELIAEGVLAVEMAARAQDIALSIHAHPTLSETIMESAESVFGQSTHAYRRKSA